jgi:hypothetical protein
MVTTSPQRPTDTVPAEAFWQRYSPHHEAELSAAGSFVIHALALGTLVLFAALLAGILRSDRSLPVETVRINPTLGDGKPGGPPDGGIPAEDLPPPDGKQPGVGRPADMPRPGLAPLDRPKEEKFDPPDLKHRAVGKEMAERFDRIREQFRKLPIGDGVAPGTGDKARKGDGGDGPGTGTLNPREKRMLRWHMKFAANDSREYVNQLSALGAILAFPVSEKGGETEYRVVRDLKKKPAELKKEDLTKIQRIYWIDDKRGSAIGVAQTLGLKLAPDRFVAFMPDELEKKLFKMERNHVEKVLKQPFDEDRIEETIFRVEKRGAGFEPVLDKVVLKR